MSVNKYFHRISNFSLSVRMFINTPITVIFFPYRGQNHWNETKLTCNQGFRWIADSTPNDSLRRPSILGEKSRLKYPKPLQSLLSMNQILIKM